MVWKWLNQLSKIIQTSRVTPSRLTDVTLKVEISNSGSVVVKGGVQQGATVRFFS